MFKCSIYTLSCLRFQLISEHFGENSVTQRLAAAKLWCLNYVQFFLEHPVYKHTCMHTHTANKHKEHMLYNVFTCTKIQYTV